MDRRIITRVMLAASVVAGSACRTAAAQPPDTSPGPALGSAEGPLPDPGSGQPVSLRGILAWADQNAPAAEVARARLARARAERAGAKPFLRENPVLSAEAGRKSAGTESGVEVGAALVQPFEIAGERGLRLEVADRMEERLEAERSQTRWEVHSLVHLAFHDALLAKERVEVATSILDFQEELLDYTRRRFEAGEIGSLPVRVTEGETAQARQRKIAAEQAYLAARLSLAEVSGWPVEEPPVPAGELPAPREAPPLGRLLELASRHHPALHRQRRLVAELRARTERADRDAWPEPALGVRYGREEVGPGEETRLLGLLRLPLPIWRRNQGERAEKRAELSIAEAREDAIVFRLRARLARAASAVDAAARRVELFSEEVVPEFEESLRLLRRAFELGEIDILEVSVARERFLDIQFEALEAYRAYYDAVADLEAEVGVELWPVEEHQSAARDRDHAPGEESRPGEAPDP